jgi:hypothetical protein
MRSTEAHGSVIPLVARERQGSGVGESSRPRVHQKSRGAATGERDGEQRRGTTPEPSVENDPRPWGTPAGERTGGQPRGASRSA